MLKKFFAVTFALMLFAAQASAATFQSPVKLGSVGTAGMHGLSIDGATKIDGDSDGKSYTKGVALFGDKLYLHFDDATADDFNAGSYFGSSDVKNAVQYYVFEGSTKISQVKNDTGVDMYLLETEYGAGNRTTLIGNRDGKWVKFFDTNDAKNTYGLRGYFTKNVIVSGNTITLEFSSFDEKNSCELRYRWDAAAQWFAVEKI